MTRFFAISLKAARFKIGMLNDDHGVDAEDTFHREYFELHDQPRILARQMGFV